MKAATRLQSVRFRAECPIMNTIVFTETTDIQSIAFLAQALPLYGHN